MTAAAVAAAPPAAGVHDPAPKRAAPQWPEPLGVAAMHGLAGEVVQTILPHTEADSAALLGTFLAAAGNAMHRHVHTRADGARHAANEFVVLVGPTAKGRKGTSWAQIHRLMAMADPGWAAERVVTGLSSGEGVATAVRDDAESPKGGMTPGIADKRLLCLAPEYASVLRVMERDGNTLSATMRDAWDRGHLRTLVRRDPLSATGTHISLLGHVTADEVRRYLTATECGNGYANRHLWMCCRRSKCLPEGGEVPPGELAALAGKLRDVLAWARTERELRRDDVARAMWAELYPALSEGEAGLLGAVTSRAEAHALRLALIYAALDRSAVIRDDHLRAGLAVWDYAYESARWVFGDAAGDPVADTILGALRDAPEGLARTDIRDLGGRHWGEARVDAALRSLAGAGLVRSERRETGGRPREVWLAAAR